MSELRVNTIRNSAGSGDPDISGAAKAWVNFNGTGTVAIRAGFNVSSITDGGVGLYTVNFTTAMPDVNYAVCMATNNNGSIITASRAEPMSPCVINLATAGFGYNHREGSGAALVDVGQAMFSVFG